jgi:hypothetical protein
MPLTLRSTGLGSGIDKDRSDYTVYSGQWNGHIYEVRGGPEHLPWFGRCTSQASRRAFAHSRVVTLEAAKAEVEASWRQWVVGVWGGQPLSLALRASSHFSIWDWPHFRASGSVWKLPSRSMRPLCHDTVTSQVPSLLSLICTTGGGDVSAIGTICARFLTVATLGKPSLFKGAHYRNRWMGEAEGGGGRALNSAAASPSRSWQRRYD